MTSSSAQQEPMEDKMHRRSSQQPGERLLVSENTRSSSAMTKDDDGHHPSANKRLQRVKVMISLQPFRFILLSTLLMLLVAVGLFLPSPQSSSSLVSLSSAASATTSDSVSLKKTLPSSSETTTDRKSHALDFAQFANCTVHTPPPRSEWTSKPLWFPSYPNSLDDNVVKSMISGLTGLSAGAKSFYASSKRMDLRQCKAKTETAACLLVHPMVEMKPGPESKSKEFHGQFIYLLRNPATVLPAFMNGKRIKYAKKEGQTPIDEWRQSRDSFLEEGLWKGYRAQLKAWKSLAPTYGVAMYLVYEELMDIEKGPAALRKLRSVMSEAGFPTAPEHDTGCLWFQSVGGKEALERHERYGYEFNDYIPGYTKAQQSFLIKELEDMMKEYQDDEELVRILTDYRNYARDKLILDKAWVNQTTA